MSINGIPQNPLLASLAPLGRPATANGTTANGTTASGTTPTGIAPNGTGLRPTLDRATLTERPATRPSIASAPSTVPPEAPAGTDPALWSVLTTEERVFFAKTANLGPLTYGKIKSATMPAPPAMRGGRLDVRA